MMNGVLVHVAKPGEIRFGVCETGFPVLKPHFAGSGSVFLIDCRGSRGMKGADEPGDGAGLRVFADEVIMIGEHSPGLQPPIGSLGQGEKCVSEKGKASRGGEKRLLMMSSGGDHVGAGIEDPMCRGVRPVAHGADSSRGGRKRADRRPLSARGPDVGASRL